MHQVLLFRLLRHRFVRETIAELPTIKLIGLPQGENVPLGRVVWSITCSDARERDRLYGWLLHRIDRWEAWADLACKRGARALSEHLLQMK